MRRGRLNIALLSCVDTQYLPSQWLVGADPGENRLGDPLAAGTCERKSINERGRQVSSRDCRRRRRAR